MRQILLTFILLLSFGIQSVLAVTGTPNEIFRPLSKQIVQKIVDNGTTKIGDTNLLELLDLLDTVEWRTFDLGFLAGSGGKRQTSMYFVKDRMVVVNMLSLQNLVGKPVRLTHWALHEALGALGYPDEVYDLTIALTFMAQPDTYSTDRIEYVETTLSDIQVSATERQYGKEGGVTIIGGGGDAEIIEFKSLLLEHFSEWLMRKYPNTKESKKKKAIQRLIKLPIDFDKATDYNTYDFTIKDGALLIGHGALLSPDRMYTEEYLNAVLDAIYPILFK